MPKYFLFLLTLLSTSINAQEITSFQQFNGRYDYTAIGNTLNPAENNLNGSFCNILDTSSALLNLDTSNEITAAYLFWAGSGLGDTNITLNDQDFEADSTYTVDYIESPSSTLTYFSCVKDITSFVISEGNTNYTLSNLDISQTLSSNPRYCQNRTNFAGWSIYIVYKNNTLPLNQVNLFVGLNIINRNATEKTIIIDNLNVLDNQNAKIGFLAWEGDNALNYGESLSINGNTLSSPPLNSTDNAFNGTNSFTGSNQFYNVDLDVYDIENNINPGDTQAEIKLTTGAFDIFGTFRADLIILNNIITVLNSQVPDATITLDNYLQECNSNEIDLEYTVSNLNSTEILPNNTSIAFFANNILIGQTVTDQIISIDESVTYTTTLVLPSNLPTDYVLTISVDNDGAGNSAVIEISETNNDSVTNQIALPPQEQINSTLEGACPNNLGLVYFNLNKTLTPSITNTYTNFSFYENLTDLEQNQNEITNLENYEVSNLPSSVYVLAKKSLCNDIIVINLIGNNCPPTFPEGISPNNDGLNDFFNITFSGQESPKYDLKIFNRYGTLVFQGNESEHWKGNSNRGINKNRTLPVGTYYYVLQLIRKKHKALTGWVYLTK